MTGEAFALNVYKGMYFGRNNLTYLYTDRLITNSEPFHKRDSNVHVGTTKWLLSLSRLK